MQSLNDDLERSDGHLMSIVSAADHQPQGNDRILRVKEIARLNLSSRLLES